MLQDLPEHFEENMEKWMKNFLILLTTDSKQLQVEVNVSFFCYKTTVQWKVSLGTPPLKGYKLLKYENTKKEKKCIGMTFISVAFIERKRFFHLFHLRNDMWKDEGVLHV